MRFSRREIVATAIVAAIVVPYVGYLVRGAVPFVDTAREMAATAVLLGFAAARVAGGRAFRGQHGRTAGWIGVLAAGGGTALIVWGEPALLTEMLLALFIGSIVVIWAMAVRPQAVTRRPSASSGRRV